MKTGRVGLGSAILGRAERKQRREPTGPVDRELGHTQERVKGGWAGLAPGVSWVSAHYRVGVRKILFFFQSFHNLQTNLNSSQIRILMTSIRKIKYKSTSSHQEKYAMV
jgi:hypothetical protein